VRRGGDRPIDGGRTDDSFLSADKCHSLSQIKEMPTAAVIHEALPNWYFLPSPEPSGSE